MTTVLADRLDFIAGDTTGLAIPAHPDALREASVDFLTRAFRTFGSLGADNAVACITRFERCPGGSTGTKLFLSVEYERADPALHTDLFVKFSRDFNDARRDHPGRFEMESEVPFAQVSRLPGFPIAVPTPYFADYHRATGTGIVITQRIPFGEQGIEPHRQKTLDWMTLDDPLAHYRQVVTALARLCAAHRSGSLAPDLDERFPFDPVAGSADPIRYTRAQLRAELDLCFDFARKCPRLLPEEVRTDGFMAKMEADTWAIVEHEAAIQRYLTGNPDMRALCHWNAHIDNCFFWHDAGGELHCGFIDWGRVGQITFGSALWGGLSAAHHDIWDHHLHELLELFVAEYCRHGGPAITVEELEFHLTLHIAAMGVARVLAFPEVILFRLPGCVEATGPHDPMFLPVENARNTLHVYTVFLKFWRRQDFGHTLERLLQRGG